MGRSWYRKDLKGPDFEKLHRIRTGFRILAKRRQISPRFMGEVTVKMIEWYNVGFFQSRFHRLKEREMEMVAFTRRDFRRVCRYIGMTPEAVAETLLRFSMLSCSEKLENGFGYIYRLEGVKGKPVYLIEARRLEISRRPEDKNEDEWILDTMEFVKEVQYDSATEMNALRLLGKVREEYNRIPRDQEKLMHYLTGAMMIAPGLEAFLSRK